MSVEYPEYTESIKKKKAQLDALALEIRQETNEFYKTIHLDFMKSLIGKCFYKIDNESGNIKYYFRILSFDAQYFTVEEMRLNGYDISLSCRKFVSLDFMLDGWDGETFSMPVSKYKKLKKKRLSLFND